ncbi:MAG: hypothetical protein M9928_21835 [Anaerolineae bacterium]|nr:hypothetical protein [Anaerolineae bacterium]
MDELPYGVIDYIDNREYVRWYQTIDDAKAAYVESLNDGATPIMIQRINVVVAVDVIPNNLPPAVEIGNENR